MKRMKTTALGCLTALAATACHHGDEPMAPAQMDAMVEAAPALSLRDALHELDLDAEQRSRLDPLVDELSASMMDVHESMARFHESEDVDRTEAHAVLEAEMEGLHERHDVLMQSLTEEQRQAFVDHVRTQLEGHGVHDEGRHGDHHVGLGHGGGHS